MPIKVRSGNQWVQVSDGADGSSSVPSGAIVMYNSASAPNGWVLCDNSSAAQNAGAPDLRDRFIIGSGNNYSIDDKGGYTDVYIPQHTHGVTIDTGGNHTHTYYFRSGTSRADNDESHQRNSGDAIYTTMGTGAHDHTASTSNNTGGAAITNAQRSGRNLPPYYALTFIMKL